MDSKIPQDYNLRQFFLKLIELDANQRITFPEKLRDRGDPNRKTIKTNAFRDILDEVYKDWSGREIHRIVNTYKDPDTDVIPYEPIIEVISEINTRRRTLDRFLEDACITLKNSQKEFWQDYDHEAIKNKVLDFSDLKYLFRKYGVEILEKYKETLSIFHGSADNVDKIDLKSLRDDIGKYLMSTSTVTNKSGFGELRNSKVRPRRKIKEILDMILSAIKEKGANAETYFERYGYNPNDRYIQEIIFDRGLKDLKLDFNINELEDVKAELGLVDGKSEMNLDPLRSSSLKERSRSPHEKKLDYVFEETIEIMKKDPKLDLMSEFNMLGNKRIMKIKAEDFQKVYKDKVYTLADDIVKLIVETYGIPRTMEIDYKKFLDALEEHKKSMSNKMSASIKLTRQETLKFENKMQDFYKKIRNTYKTFEEFVKNFDTNGNGRIERSEFLKAIQSIYKEADEKEAEFFFTKFTSDQNFLDAAALKKAFKSLLELDAKVVIDTIVHQSEAQKKSLYSLILLFPTQGEFCLVKYVQMAILAIAPTLHPDEVLLLLSYFDIAINRGNSINFDAFCSKLDDFTYKSGRHLFRRSDTAFSIGSNSTESPNKKLPKSMTEFSKKMDLTSKEHIVDFFGKMMPKDSNELGFKEFAAYCKLINREYKDTDLNEIFRYIGGDKKTINVLDFIEKVPVQESAPSTVRGPSLKNLDGASQYGGTRMDTLSDLGARLDARSKIHEKSEVNSDFGGPTSNLSSERFTTIFDKTRWAKEIFHEIKVTLATRGLNFRDYFQIYKDRATFEDFKISLHGLKINEDHLPRLCTSVADDKQANCVNLEWFESCYNFYIQQPIDNKTAKLNPYQDIKKELKRQGTDLEKVFKDYSKQGSVSNNIFKKLVEEKLSVPLNETQFKAITDDIQDKNGYVSLNKLQKALEETKEQQADLDVKNLVQKIKDTAKKTKSDLEELFRHFDKDGDGYIDFLDFKESAKVYEKNIQTLSDAFKAFCKESEHKISRAEFYKIFEDVDARYKRLSGMIKSAYIKLGIDISKEFEKYDQDHKGLLNFKGFNEMMKLSEENLERADVELLFDKSFSTVRDYVKKDDFLRIFVELTDSEAKHIRELIKEIHDKIVALPKEQKNELLNYVDKKGEKKVTPEEFVDVLNQIKPGLLKSEAISAFNISDRNKKHYLTPEEFNQILGFDGNKNFVVPKLNDVKKAETPKGGRTPKSTPREVNLYKDLSKEELIHKVGWASDIFEEISYLIGVEETTIDLFFNPGKEPIIDKILVKKQFKALGLEISDELFDRLVSYFTSSESDYKINTGTFVDMVYYFNSHPKKSLDEFKLKHLDKIRQDIISKLNYKKLTFAEAFNHLNKDDKGTCFRVDLQTLLINKFDVPNNSNLKILFNYIKDGTGEVNLGRLEFFLNELMRSMLKDGPSGAKPVEEAEINIQKLINHVRLLIEDSRLKVEAVFKQFDVIQDQELSYEEFYRALKYFDAKLSRQEIWSIFNYLDKDKQLKISKVKFVRTFGKLSPDLMLNLLEWAIPIFKEIANLQDSRKIDLFGNIQRDGEYCEVKAFRATLIMNNFPYDNYRREMDKIIDIASDELTGRLNIEAIGKLIEKAKKIRNKKLPHQFTPDEEQKVFMMIKDISSFIKLDGLDFDELFLPYDYMNRAKISIEDMNRVLTQELMINMTPTLQLLYDFLSDEEDLIDLVQFKKLVVKEDEELRKVLNLPYFLKELKTKFNNDIPLIIKVFDPNKNLQITLEEFVNACMRALSMKPDFSKYYFLQLDTDHDGTLSIPEFQGALMHEGDIKWERTKQIRDEMEKKRIVLARTFTNFDRNNDRMLTLAHIKSALSMSDIYVDEKEIEDLLHHYQIEPDKFKKYDYTKLIEKILSDSDEDEKFGLADRTLQMLKQKFIVSNIPYEKDIEAMDETLENKILWKQFEDYLTQKYIPISNLEKQNLRWLMKPSADDKISWRNLVEYIHLGVNRIMTKEELLDEGNFMKDLILSIKYQMKRNHYSVTRLFGTDKDVIPMDDFRSAIGYLGFKTHLNFVKLCKLVSEGKTGEFASLQKFEFLLHNVEDTHDGFERAEKEAKNEKLHEYFRNKDPKDKAFIEQRFDDLKRFMVEDKLTFKDLFLNLNIQIKDGLIYAKDFEKILAKKLQLDIDTTLKRFIKLIHDNNEMINIEMLEKLIDAPKAYADKKQPVADLQLDRLKPKGDKAAPTKDQPAPDNLLKPKVVTVDSARTKEDTFRDLSDVLNGAFIVSFSGNLISDMLVFFRTKKLTNPERYRLFDPKLVGKIPKPHFVDTVKAMNIKGAREMDILDIFYKLDKNKTEYVSENEFRLAFDDSNAKVLESEVGLNKDMLQEILTLFNEIDEDKSGFITFDEFKKALSKLGMTQSEKNAAEIFSKFDKSGDEKIDYDEFKEIMMEKMKKEMMQLDDVLADLREAFRTVDIQNKRELTEPQLNQALLSLGIELSENEMRALFSCLDVNNSKSIDIDEFIGFIMSPPERDAVGDEADNAIYNIRKGKKISPSELLNSFKDMPYNFVFSFTREILKKLNCLPSASLKPKTVGGVLYTDIFPNKVDLKELNNPKKKNVEVNLKSLIPIPTALGAEIKLTLATGVPIPDTKSVDRTTMILGREVRACLFDRSGNRFIGNIVYIPVVWNQAKEDQWVFPSDTSIEDQSIYIRLSEWDAKNEKDMQLMIVFEFVLFVKRNDQLIEMCSCWAGLDVHYLRKNGVSDLQLQGGSPLRVSTIDAQDVRADRKGWRNVVKKLSSPVTSKLKVEYKCLEKLPNEVKSDMEFLPSTILLSKNAFSLYVVYREYLGKLYLDAVERKINVDLANEMNAKAFRKVIDCPDTRNVFYEFWNTQIYPKYRKERDPAVATMYLEKTMTYLGLLLNCSEFRFNHSDPTGVMLLNKNLAETRERLSVIYLTKALNDLSNVDTKKKVRNTKPSQDPDLTKDLSFKPFSVDEIMDDESEIHLVEQMKSLRGGARK